MLLCYLLERRIGHFNYVLTIENYIRSLLRTNIPQINDSFYQLQGVNYFSKIDLWSSYHQLRLRECDIPKMPFRMSYGHFEFLIVWVD